MIKELLDKYGSMAFLCNSKKEFIDFVKLGTSEMKFTKSFNIPIGLSPNSNDDIITVDLQPNDDVITIDKQGKKIFVFEEDTQYILDSHVKIYNDNEQIYALIIVKNEYQFYSRKVSEHNQYPDWNKIKIVNYRTICRKNKILKLQKGEMF